MRRKCELCAIKHLEQADVLLDEAQLGYPLHRWRAVGHMAEAESELLKGRKEIAEIIRTERVQTMEDLTYEPEIEPIVAMLDIIVRNEHKEPDDNRSTT